MFTKKLLFFLKPNVLKIAIFSVIVAFGAIDPDYGQGVFQMSIVLKILIFMFLWPGLVGSGIVIDFYLLIVNIIYIYIISCFIYCVFCWLKNKMSRMTEVNPSPP